MQEYPAAWRMAKGRGLDLIDPSYVMHMKVLNEG